MLNFSLIPGGASTSRIRAKCDFCSCVIGPGRRYRIARHDVSGRLAPICSLCAGDVEEPAEVQQICPPPTHRGAVNTECDNSYGKSVSSNPIAWSIDDLELTWHDWHHRAVMAMFTPPNSEPDVWKMLPCGRNGYRSGAVRGLVCVYWDGAEPQPGQPGMGVHVRCSGQACRQLEAEGLVRLDDGGWEAFLGLMRDTEASCARIDVASDDRRELVKPELVEAAITNVADAKEGLPVIVTRFRKAPQYVVTDLTTGKPSTGWSRYLGTGKSRIRVRMYDKRAESIEKGLADPGPWVRVEVQARDERADWLLKQIVADSGAAVAECLLNYVDFREVDPADSNRSRWVTCSWWVSFLATLEKRKSTCTGVVRSLEQTLQWLSRQVSPALAFVLHAPGFGLDALLSLLPEGTERLQPWHIKTLEAMGMKMGPDENPAETVPQLQDGQYFLGFESVDRIPVSVPSTPGLGFGLL